MQVGGNNFPVCQNTYFIVLLIINNIVNIIETMPSPKAEKITISSEIQNILTTIVNCTKNPYRLVRRAKIILELAHGITISQISQKWDLSRSRIRHWKNKWKENYSLLQQGEQENLSSQKLKLMIISILNDAQRAGRPNTYSSEQIVQIVSVACEEPSNSLRPVSHWSRRELKDEVIKRGIVENISDRTVGRFLKRSETATTSLSLLA